MPTASTMPSSSSPSLRQAEDLAALPVGRRVVVIGGGMTAIDAAVQSKLLGAEEVTICYRRGKEHMNASEFEQDLAASKGVTIRHWLQPKRVVVAVRQGGRHRARIYRDAGRQARRARPDRASSRPTRCSRRSARLSSARRSTAAGRRSPCGTAASRSTRKAAPRSPRSGPAATASSTRRRPDCLGRRAGPRRGGEHPPGTHLEREGMSMADIRNNFVGIKSPKPVLAGLRAADRQGLQRHPRLQGGLGRRGLEDARRGRAAGRQRQRPALRRDLGRRPPPARPEQHRAHHRPRPADQSARDQAGQEGLAGPRRSSCR